MQGPGEWPIFDDDVAWEQAQAELSALELGDGLPLVPPTRARVNAMLAAAGDPARSHGLLPPLFGDLTTSAIAYTCVLAGCVPAALPVVMTAATACLDEPFNMLGLATTTGTPAVAAIVHGPVARALGMSAHVNCLGPGNSANATLGRAIALVLRNIGGMRTGAGDAATMGQPAKYGLCFPEAPEQPFAPFHVRRGFAATISAVTVLGISGTMEVLPSIETGNWDRPESVLEPVALAMRASLVTGGGARKNERGEQVLLLPPELATLLAQRGWGIAEIQSYLFTQPPLAGSGAVAASADDIHVVVTGGPGIKMTVLPLWGGGTRTVTRALVAL